jgi:GNAT superfamily N-acetyltransferase
MVPEVVSACRLAPARRSALASVLAEAFEHDPMQAWLFPNPKRRMPRLSRFYERDIAVRLEERSAACFFDTHALAFWLPSDGGSDLSVTSALRLAPCFATVAAHHPIAAPRVLATALRQRPSEPHWYLSHLAVRPDHQGRGLGRALLEWGLEQADRDGVGTYLETTNPDNLAFYRAAGYAQVGLVRVERAPTVWTLWRGPTAASLPAPTRQATPDPPDRGGTPTGSPPAGTELSGGDPG